MRKGYLLAAILLVTVLFAGCGIGNTRHVERRIGESVIYTSREIVEAMDVVMDFFEKEFDGCDLLTLEYQDEFSRERAKGWEQQYDAEEAIVLLSSFRVGSSGGDGSLNPNSTYERYQWVLVRNGNGKWTLKTWGYG